MIALMGITTRALVDEFALRAEAIYLRALSAIAARGKDPQATSLLRERQEAADRALIDRIVPDGPMAKLAARLELGRRQINFFWAAAGWTWLRTLRSLGSTPSIRTSSASGSTIPRTPCSREA
jgi:hypothetical protein